MPKPRTRLMKTCEELQSLQRHRTWHIKSRNMLQNRLRATVANLSGYDVGGSEKERKKSFSEADKTIKRVLAGEIDFEHSDLIKATWIGVDQFENSRIAYEKEMLASAKKLPVIDWCLQDQQRGFGVLSLATVIGETGNLNNYPNPGKLWRRMGVAPFTKDGETLMGATWKSRSKSKTQIKLHSTDWEKFGYNPRRRSISFLIGENLLKLNKSVYRERYDTKRAELKELHSDYNDMRCHRHGMLLACKLLYKLLWIEWTEN